MWMVWFVGCSQPTTPLSVPSQPTETPTPTGSFETPVPAAPIEDAVVTDLASYYEACVQALGPWPDDLHCGNAIEVPTTVTTASGTVYVDQLDQLEDGFRCDRSSIAGCAPGTRMGKSTNDQGTQWALGCRNVNDDFERFDQINVIASHPETGATCFFETPFAEDRYGTVADTPPIPGSTADIGYLGATYWKPFERLSRQHCLQCHDNDPFLHNPWIRQVDAVPERDPFAPYRIVAQDALQARKLENWSFPREIQHPDTAPCRTCHRLAEGRSCRLALEATGRSPRPQTSTYFVQTYPYNRWMSLFDDDARLAAWPTVEAWEAEWGTAANRLAACCVDVPPAECFESGL
jgi:hypothetical protein